MSIRNCGTGPANSSSAAFLSLAPASAANEIPSTRTMKIADFIAALESWGFGKFPELRRRRHQTSNVALRALLMAQSQIAMLKSENLRQLCISGRQRNVSHSRLVKRRIQQPLLFVAEIATRFFFQHR